MSNTGFNQVFGSFGTMGFGNGFSYTLTSSSPAASSLILDYDFSNASCYVGSGSAVVDLAGNSDATLFNSPAFSSGSLTFNGTNQYLLTNTDLNSKLSPPNTSKAISVFMWVNPLDNGVLLGELGQAAINTGYHDAQIEMVAGKLRFAVWNNISRPVVSSSISTPTGSWYHVGFTHDGSTLKGYVNGALAATASYTRLTPYESGRGLFYQVAATEGTNLGDGTAANMKLGELKVYNVARSAAEVSSSYEDTKSKWPNPPVTPPVVTDRLELWFDSRYPASYPGSGTSWTDMANGVVGTMNGGVTYDSGTKSMVFNGSNGRVITSNYTSDLSTGYSLEAYVKWNGFSSYDGVIAYNQSPHYINLEYYFGQIRFESAGTVNTRAPGPTIGTWYHIVCTWDGSNNRIYVDGTLAAGPNSTTVPQYNNHTAPWVMGQWDGYLNGAIRSAKLYSKALSAAEVTQNYAATVAGP